MKDEDAGDNEISTDGPLAIGGLVRHFLSDLRALFAFCARPLKLMRRASGAKHQDPGERS